ncbi:MAG: zinc ribbon domain-containing protein [Planctomycetes bacterium]|nr:zinc ribbon domain-containing protein [Planctomycetota bacterium]
MPEQQKCPNCGTLVSHVTVVCTKCGTNLKTGQQFATQVEARKPKRRAPMANLLTNLSFLLAVGIIIGVVVVYNKLVARKQAQLAEQMKLVNTNIAEGDKLAEQQKYYEARNSYQTANKELDAYREMAGEDKKALAKAEKKDTEIRRRIDDTHKKEGELARAQDEARKREAEIAQRKARGLEEFQGEWLHPNQIRAKGFRKVAGQWVSVDALVKQHGYTLYRGDYRSPDEMKAFGLQHFEGVWRSPDYVRQAKGDVKVGDEWLTEEEMIKRLPQKVIVLVRGKSREDEYVGEILQNDANGVKIAQRLYGPSKDAVEVTSAEADILDGAQVVAKMRKGDTLKKVGEEAGRLLVEGELEGRHVRGLVSQSDVQPAMTVIRKPQGWTKAMATWKLEDISAPYRDAIRKMASRNPADLEAAARWWDTEAKPEIWPNCRWKADRARDLAGLLKSGRADLIGKSTQPQAAPVPSAPPPKPEAANAAPPAPAPKPQPTPLPAESKAQKAPSPAGNVVTILADEVPLMEGDRVTATAKKGQAFTLVRIGERSCWLVEGEWGGKRKRAWVRARDVLITADDAKLMAGNNVVATARKGQTLDFIRSGERGLVLARGQFDGKHPTGWLARNQCTVREHARATVVVQEDQTPLKVGDKEVAKLPKGQTANFLGLDDKGLYALVEAEVAGKKTQGWVAKRAVLGPEAPSPAKSAKAK